MPKLCEPARQSVKVLGGLLGQDDVEIIDTRGMDFFLGYIPGSRRFPIELFNKEVGRLAAEHIESGKMVVFVDKWGGACASSCAQDFIRSVNSMSASPSCKVYFLEGGFSSWEAEFANHEKSYRYIARSPSFPGAPHAGLVSRKSPCYPPQQRAQHDGVTAKPDRTLAGRSVGEKLHYRGLSGNFGGYAHDDTLLDAAQEASSELAPTSPAPIALGDVVLILSSRSGAWVQAYVIAANEDLIKANYFVRGKCCLEDVRRDSLRLRVEGGLIGG